MLHIVRAESEIDAPLPVATVVPIVGQHYDEPQACFGCLMDDRVQALKCSLIVHARLHLHWCMPSFTETMLLSGALR